MTLRAVIFDHKTLLGLESATTSQVRGMLNWLASRDIAICVFSTQWQAIDEEFRHRSFPPAGALVAQRDVAGRKNRGSPLWIDAAAERLSLERHEFLYVGCTNRDWRSAINAGVFYCHAGWHGARPSDVTCLTIEAPESLLLLVDHFLLQQPRWSFRLDDAEHGLTLRSLLPAAATLPRTDPAGSFRLQDVFTYERDVRVGPWSARDLLGLHVLASCYVEGLLSTNALFCVYPGSKPGTTSEQLESYVKPAASLVKGYYRNDLLVRAAQAPDTSLARWKASQTGGTAPVSIATQAQTVHVGEGYRGRLDGRTVIVFDDFTTTGMSLEWARLLLLAAGAARVVLLTIGKYGTDYRRYSTIREARYYPFQLNDVQADDFATETQYLHFDQANEVKLADLFNRWIAESQHSSILSYD